MPKKAQRAAESHLEILMMHIIKIIIQSWKKTYSWLNSIRNARKAIKELQEKNPSLNRNFFEKIWDMVFKRAKKAPKKKQAKNATSKP